MQGICGFDFGTSNSTIGIHVRTACQLIPLEEGKPTIRSAIFCDNELKEWVFGQRGVDNYLEGVPGRLMMSLKSVLGSPLMNDETFIFNEFIPYKAVLAKFVKHIKTLAENAASCELTHVVMGRPIHFHDHDKKADQLAQDTLEEIAQSVGFKEIYFQYEPIAAALAYEASIDKPQLALVVDMGGGTSDFTVIRLQPNSQKSNRVQDVLATGGIHIAGTDFDQRLSLRNVMPLLGLGSLVTGSSSTIEVPSMYYYELTKWHLLNNLYSAATISKVKSLKTISFEKHFIDRLIKVLELRAGHHILDAVEKAKQALSAQERVQLDLSFIEKDLFSNIERAFFNDAINDHVQSIIVKIQDTIKLAGVSSKDIHAVFYTGGSTKIPAIRDQINAMFPGAQIVQGDAFGSVGMGLTLDAMQKYR